MARHTPAPLIDVGLTIPSLASRALQTVRLHPRGGPEPATNASKLGGHFLWPEDEPWPTCTLPEIALHADYNWSDDKMNLWEANHPKHNDAYIGVLQLRADDVPELIFPGNTNLFQLLWCPRDHESYHPACKIFWWREEEIVKSLLQIPTPSYPEDEWIPNICTLDPEKVIEYPCWELSEQEEIEIQTWQADKEENLYEFLLSTAPGTKVGGYVRWIQRPETPVCKCGEEMKHLLTIDSSEFDVGDYFRWCPLEEQGIWERIAGTSCREDPATHHAAAEVQVGSGLSIGDCGRLYFFICRDCPDWPIKSVFQCT